MTSAPPREPAPGPQPAGDSYDPACFEPLFAAEDRHFWFRARCRTISALARKVASGLDTGYRVLEAGCGTGNVLRALKEACAGGQVVGMDLYAEGLGFARRRSGCSLVQGDLHQPPFRVRFQIVGLFDVLEHLPDDRRVLRDLHALLLPRGALLLTVPAHPLLWSYFDEASRHCRRYTLSELEGKLREAGFELEYLGYYMAAVYPWMRLRRLLDRAAPLHGDTGRALQRARGELRIVPGVNGIFRFLLEREAGWIARGRRLPFGASLVAVARRPAAEGVGPPR